MNEGHRKLVEAYEQVAEFLPETPITVWRAWMHQGCIGLERHEEFMNARPL